MSGPPSTTVPPVSVEAEESVLGAMLVAEPTLTRVIDEVKLSAGDFYLDRHRAIFAAIATLFAGGKPVDELTVTAALSPSQRKAIGAAGLEPKHVISELAAKVPAAGNAKHYAEIVKDAARRRGVIDVARRAAAAAEGGVLNGEVTDLADALRAVVQGTGEIGTIRASEVRLRVPKFLDAAEMIPTRSITVAFGRAGLGKTLYGITQCAAVTRGEMRLEGPAPVLISSQEDDAEAVLAPRLVAAGADLELVHFVEGLTLPSQVPALASRARNLGAALVLIDPIAAHLDPSIDSHRDAAIRAALAPLAETAQDLDLAVLVVCHPNKAAGITGLDRISGSGAFGNAARSVIVFGLDPGDPDGETGGRRIVAHLKCNVGKRAASISAEIDSVDVSTEEGVADVPRLLFTGTSEHSADDVLTSPTGDERSERDEAGIFLAEQLTDGPIRVNELRRAVESASITWRTAERAKKDLGIRSVKGPDGWYWLPVGQTTLEGER